MTFPELATLIRQRWPDARVEDDCVLVNVASRNGPSPVTVRVSYSPVYDEIGFIIDIIDSSQVPEFDVVAASAGLARGSLVIFGDRIVLRHREKRTSFVDVDLLRMVRSLARAAGTLRRRWAAQLAA